MVAESLVAWLQKCGLLSGNGAGSKRISNSSTRRLTAAAPSVSSTAVTITPASSTSLNKKDKTPSAAGLYSFDSSDLPLKASAMGLLHPHCCGNHPPTADKNSDIRPKSATVSSAGAQPIPIEKPKFQSLFNFDDALSLTPDQVDTNWMYDPLDSDDDFCYTLDVETMSVCSDTSIVASAITCDTKLKDDDEEFSKAPLRKTHSSNK